MDRPEEGASMLIRRQLLKAALHAVNITPDGRVESTNGHLAFVLSDTEPLKIEDFPVVKGVGTKDEPTKATLVRAELVTKLIAAMAKRSPIPVLETVQVTRDEKAKVTMLAATDLEAPMVVQISDDQDGTFPDLKKVTPKFKEGKTVEVTIGVAVLEALLKAVKEVHEGYVKPGAAVSVTLLIPTDRKVVDSAFTAETHRNSVRLEAVLMPMRK
jgi:hypothetical protein